MSDFVATTAVSLVALAHDRQGLGLGLVPVCIEVRWGTWWVRWCTAVRRGRFGGRFPG